MNTPISKCFPEIKKRCASPEKYYAMLRQVIESFPHPKGASVTWAILNKEWQTWLIDDRKFSIEDVVMLRLVFEQVRFGVEVPIQEKIIKDIVEKTPVEKKPEVVEKKRYEKKRYEKKRYERPPQHVWDSLKKVHAKTEEAFVYKSPQKMVTEEFTEFLKKHDINGATVQFTMNGYTVTMYANKNT